MTEEDYRYKMASTISRLETKLDGVQEFLTGLGKRVDVLDGECVRRSALWGVATIAAMLFSGVFASYYTSSSSQQKSLNETTHQQEVQERQQASLQEQLKRLADTAEDNRKALETWFKTNAKRN